MALDLKALMQRYLETAQRILKQHGHLTPAAFLFLPDGIQPVALAFDDPSQDRGASKYRAYAKLFRLARERSARALLTINDARVRMLNLQDPQSREFMRRYKQGDLKPTDQECIIVAAKQRHGPLRVAFAHYRRNGKQFIFAPPKWTDNAGAWKVFSDLFKDW